MKKGKELGKKNEGKEYKKKNNIDEIFRKFKNENMAYTNDRAQVQYKKEIKFDKSHDSEENYFMELNHQIILKIL